MQILLLSSLLPLVNLKSTRGNLYEHKHLHKDQCLYQSSPCTIPKKSQTQLIRNQIYSTTATYCVRVGRDVLDVNYAAPVHIIYRLSVKSISCSYFTDVKCK